MKDSGIHVSIAAFVIAQSLLASVFSAIGGIITCVKGDFSWSLLWIPVFNSLSLIFLLSFASCIIFILVLIPFVYGHARVRAINTLLDKMSVVFFFLSGISAVLITDFTIAHEGALFWETNLLDLSGF